MEAFAFENVDYPPDYQTFIDKYEQIILICFGSGTSFDHSEQFWLPLIRALKMLDHSKVGIVVSIPKIKKIESVNKRLSDIKQDRKNLLFDEYVPSKELLAHEKTKLLIGHAGGYTSMEAFYNGVPILCHPSIFDQTENCKNYELQGIGIRMINP